MSAELDTHNSVHQAGCDGWRTAHSASVRQISRAGRGMWHAHDSECGWSGTTVGPDALDLARREAADHSETVRCIGECADSVIDQPGGET